MFGVRNGEVEIGGDVGIKDSEGISPYLLLAPPPLFLHKDMEKFIG